MPRGEIADPTSAVFVGPGRLAAGPQLSEGMAIFVDADGQHVGGVLGIVHIVLFVGDDETAHASSYGVILVGDFDFVGAHWRMALSGRTLPVAEVFASGDICRVVIEQPGAASLDKNAYGPALFGGDPLHSHLF